MMKSLPWVIAAAIAATVIASSSPAQAQLPDRPEAWSAEDLAAQVAAFGQSPFEDTCERGPLILGEHGRRYLGEQRRDQLRQAFCVEAAADNYHALGATEQLEAAGFPVPPEYGLRLAALSQNLTKTLPRFEALLLDTSRPISKANWEGAIEPALGLLTDRGLRRQAEAVLARAAAAGRIDQVEDEAHRVAFAYVAMKPTLESDPAAAERLLPHIWTSHTHLSMLASRDYQALWPILEQRGTPNMATILEEQVTITRARFQRDPTDDSLVVPVLGSLRNAGRHQELVDFALDYGNWSERPGDLTQAQGWALNYAAFSLDYLGRRAEGDAILAYLADLNPRRHGWVINFAVNRAYRFAAQERWQESRAALQDARRIVRGRNPIYANGLLIEYELCTDVALGDRRRAEARLDEVRDLARTNHLVAAAAYLCLGMDEPAAQVLIDAFRNPLYREYYATTLQGPVFDTAGGPSTLPSPYDLLQRHAGLRAAFEEFARFIPPELGPAGANARYPAGN